MAPSSANSSKMLLAERVISATCKELNIARDGVEVGVHIVTPQRMRALNKQHRGKNKSTDVLSFPLNVKHDILYLGDIFINNKEPRKRFPWLLVHGLLHCFGFDHERSKKDEKVMFALQDEILTSLRN